MNVLSSQPIGMGASDYAGAVERDVAKLRELTGKVVGATFFGAMFKMMRESRLKGAIGHGGRGEEAFAGQLHGVLAERMGERTRGGVVDALFKRLEQQQRRISASQMRIESES